MRTPLSAAALAVLCTAGHAVPVADPPRAPQPPLPAAQIGPWQIGPQSTRYSSQDADHRVDARLVHSSRYRQQFGLDAGWLPSDQWALGLNLAAGRTGDFRDLVGNLVYTPVPGWHGRLSLGRLQSTDPYAFASGTADVRVRQNAWLAGLVREGPQAGTLGDLRWTVYGARAQVPILHVSAVFTAMAWCSARWCSRVLWCVLAMPVLAQVQVVGGSAGSVPQIAFRQPEIARVWNAGSFTQQATVAGSKGAVTYSSSQPAVATVHALTGLVTPIRQGQTTITAVQAPQGYFPGAQASYAVRLTSAAAVLQPWTLPPVSLVSGPLQLTPPGSSSPGAFSFTSSDPTVASISGQQLTVHRSGEAIITAAQAATDDYSAASTTARLVVNLQTPSIGGLQLPSDLVYGAASRALVAPLSDSPAAFSYASSNPQVVQVSGNQLQVVGAGVAVITATQAAQGAFAGGSVSASLTVARSTPVLNAPTGAALLESRWQSADIPMIFGITSAAMGVSGGSWSVVEGDRVQSLSTSFDGNLVVRTGSPGAFTLRYTVPETANTLRVSRDVSFFAFANQPFQLLEVSALRPDALPDGTVIGSVNGVSVNPFSTSVSLSVCADRSTVYRFRFAVAHPEPFGLGWTDPVATPLNPSGGEVVVDIPLGGNPDDLVSPRNLRVRQLGSADGVYRDVTRSVTLQVTPIVCPSAPV